ncbi:Peroxidase [Mycena venus]|uniref:Peroxidase n=1 Tax=Mycena venus TaxID=2733690 RepID=A0A8H7CKN3_9AGAR|nr:Peroxidase [Mycena venus]
MVSTIQCASSLKIHNQLQIDTELPFIQKPSIQFPSAVSLSLWRGTPQVAFMLGRPLPLALAPGPDDSVDTMLTRVTDAPSFTLTEVGALLSTYTVAGADTIDPTIPGTSFYISPSVFDTQFFIEDQLQRHSVSRASTPNIIDTLLLIVISAVPNPSDHLMARDLATNCTWKSFAENLPAVHAAFISSSCQHSTRCRLLDTIPPA